MGMSVYLTLLPALFAVPLIVSDFRRRRVGIPGLVLLGIVCAVTGWLLAPDGEFLRTLCGNYLLLALLGLGLTGYFRLRYRVRNSRFRHYFGAGDVWFLLAVAPLFTLQGFVRFLLFSCLLALGWWFFLNRRRHTIPFVGHLGIALAVWSLYFIVGSWKI